MAIQAGFSSSHCRPERTHQRCLEKETCPLSAVGLSRCACLAAETRQRCPGCGLAPPVPGFTAGPMVPLVPCCAVGQGGRCPSVWHQAMYLCHNSQALEALLDPVYHPSKHSGQDTGWYQHKAAMHERSSSKALARSHPRHHVRCCAHWQHHL